GAPLSSRRSACEHDWKHRQHARRDRRDDAGHEADEKEKRHLLRLPSRFLRRRYVAGRLGLRELGGLGSGAVVARLASAPSLRPRLRRLGRLGGRRSVALRRPGLPLLLLLRRGRLPLGAALAPPTPARATGLGLRGRKV